MSVTREQKYIYNFFLVEYACIDRRYSTSYTQVGVLLGVLPPPPPPPPPPVPMDRVSVICSIAR